MVFLSSLSGHVGHPGCGAYAGSKFAVEGMAESFAAETRQFGVRTLIVAPGRFRTKFLSTGNMKIRKGEGKEYEVLLKGLEEHLREQDGNQPGDPGKLVGVVVDAVRGRGVFERREVPLRLPLGRDAVEEMRGKYEGMLGVMEEWKDVIEGTDIDK